MLASMSLIVICTVIILIMYVQNKFNKSTSQYLSKQHDFNVATVKRMDDMVEMISLVVREIKDVKGE